MNKLNKGTALDSQCKILTKFVPIWMLKLSCYGQLEAEMWQFIELNQNVQNLLVNIRTSNMCISVKAFLASHRIIIVCLIV